MLDIAVEAISRFGTINMRATNQQPAQKKDLFRKENQEKKYQIRWISKRDMFIEKRREKKQTTKKKKKRVT